MNARQFFNAVVEMRNAQKIYFSTRSSVNLDKAKRLEKKIDDEISRVKQILLDKEQGRQQDLFNQ